MPTLRSLAARQKLSCGDIEGELELSLIQHVQEGHMADRILRGRRSQRPQGPQELAALHERSEAGRLAGQVLLRAYEKAIRQWSMRLGRSTSRHSLSREDLMSEAQMAFIKAVKKFKRDKAVKLMTYATWWMRADINRAIINHGYAIRVPAHRVEQTAEWHPDARAARRMFSLDEPLPHQDGQATRLDLLVSDQQTPEQDVMGNLDTGQVTTLLREALSRLSARERHVMIRRHLGKEQRTLQEVGDEMEVSRERVRQLETKAFNKLRKLLRKEKTTVLDALAQ